MRLKVTPALLLNAVSAEGETAAAAEAAARDEDLGPWLEAVGRGERERLWALRPLLLY